VTGGGPPLIGGSPRPHPHRSRGGRRIRPRGRLGATRRRVIGGGASRHREGAGGRIGGASLALKEEEVGILQFEVGGVSSCAPLISRGSRSPSSYFVVRGSPAVPALAPR
jgi:hypothetical protein